MRCLICGIDNKDVIYHYEYVGGIGYTKTGPYCKDEISCWQRFDIKHNLRKIKNVRAYM
jgi:hypothetical protein